ncbi:MAG: rhodanese-like domain-containing protein [bacterium]
MIFKRFVEDGLSHFSYVVGDEETKDAVVIDPRRDTDKYGEWIEKNDLNMDGVVETHLHADYASGAHELAETEGVPHYLSAYDEDEKYQATYDRVALEDGDTLNVGSLILKTVHTPGHTPEHLSYLLYPDGNEGQPTKFFTGDFLFVGSLGRPDLIGEDVKTPLAGKLYESVQKIKSMDLPGELSIHPAHGSGSLCGAGMDDSPESTLERELESNRYFSIESKEKFVESVFDALGDFPPYYKRMKATNSEGADPVLPIQPPEAKIVSTYQELTGDNNDAVLLDLRDQESFGSGHIPGSYDIGLTPKLNMWAPWVLPYDTPIYLIGDESMGENEMEVAYRKLIRVELDEVAGYLEGGFEAWTNRGYPTETVEQLTSDELEKKGPQGMVIDVRTEREYAEGHVPGAINLPVGRLPEKVEEVSKDEREPIYTVCGTGYRSSLAASLLKKAGVETVGHLKDGFGQWKQAGKTIETQKKI